MTPTNNEREAFEAKINSFNRGQKLDLTPHHDSSFGTYLYDHTECAFRAFKSVSQNEQQEAVTNLWEALGKWSAYLASNGEQANLAPPSWLIDAVSSATSPHKQIPDEWVADPDTIPSQLIERTRQAICLEFGDSGTDGYYKRILAKIFKAMLNTSPTTSLTSETNTEVGE